MKKFSGMVLVTVLLFVGSGRSFADEIVNDCRAIFINIKKHTNHKAAGACTGGINMANANAEALCRKFASDPRDCVPGQMNVKGEGYYNISDCNANEYIALACTSKDGRPYCRIGCGDRQEGADSKAIDDCMDLHYLNRLGCTLQTLEY
jgi:hypothetical protein